MPDDLAVTCRTYYHDRVGLLALVTQAKNAVTGMWTRARRLVFRGRELPHMPRTYSTAQ